MNLRAHIIEESLKLFSLKGFLSTSLQDILGACHTSKGGFYNHFKSKEDLLLAVLEKARAHWREKNLAGLDHVESPVGKVKTLLANYRDRYLSDTQSLPGGCTFITLAVELADQRPKLALELNEGFVRLKRMIHRLLEAGRQRGELREQTDTAALTELIFAGMLGASVMFGVDKSSTHLDLTINSLIRLLDDNQNTDRLQKPAASTPARRRQPSSASADRSRNGG